MSYSGCICKAKSRRYRFFIVIVASLSPLFLALTCPTPEPFPPPALKAPQITNLVVGPQKFDTYRGALTISWTPPDMDSIGIQEYAILQKADGDSGYFLLVHGIPAAIQSYIQKIDDIILPSFSINKIVRYRLYAIDSLGRSSDTSLVDSIVLLWSPQLMYPANRDTVSPDSLLWGINSVQAGFYTYSFIYNDSLGLIWKSNKSQPIYSTDGQISFGAQFLPDSILPLKSGNYSWGITLLTATNRATIAMSRFYVP